MRSRVLLLLVLAAALGVYAYQQATRPPPLVRGPISRPVATVAPVAAPPVAVPQPPEAALQKIADALEHSQGDAIEASLRALHGQYPGNAKILSYLAWFEYNRAIAGQPQPRGKMGMRYDQDQMKAASQWAEQAVAADPGLAVAWLTSARVAVARTDMRTGMEMLERAEALDPDSVPLRFAKGDALRAMAAYTGDDVHLPLAMKEYERILQAPIDNEFEFVALRQMGETAALMGDYPLAVTYLTRAIAGFQDRDLAFALESRASIHLDAGNPDAAIKDSLAALEIMRFEVAAHTLADAHLLKAGLAMKNGNEAAALPHLDAMMAFDPNPTPHMNRLASQSTTFPAVYAMFAAPMRERHGDSAVPDALIAAAEFITAKDLRRLRSLGMRFNSGDTVTNTLLFQAIHFDNAGAVSELLAQGADTSVRRNDGASLLDAARIGTQPARKEIRRLLLAKMGRPTGWTDVPVDLPKEGHWYQADRTIGVAESPRNKLFEAGMILMAGSQCSTPGKAFTCFTFYTAPEQHYSSILIPISSPEDFNALREVEAPAMPGESQSGLPVPPG